MGRAARGAGDPQPAADSTHSVAAAPASGEVAAEAAEIPGSIGPYRIVRLLGRGGQGEVYLAEDSRLGRRVALKVLTRSLSAADPALQRFRREAAAASRLDHPGICGILEVGAAGGVHYLAMRLVEGETLAAAIGARRERALTKTGSSASRAELLKTVALFEKAARALQAAHEAGLIHRDIKPGNIMVAPGDEPVILDFGLARDLDGSLPVLTLTGDLLGTPAYMSPEQLLAQRVPLDHRTDVYSLGVSLYEALALQRPFASATREGLYQQILASEPPDVRRRNSQISRDLAIVVATAMEKDRDRRYQTALDFAEDLRRVQAVEPIRARPASAALKLRRWIERKPALACAVLGIILSLATGLAVSLLLLDRARKQESAMRNERDEKAQVVVERDAAIESLRSETIAREAALRAVSSERDEKARALLRAEGLHLASRSTAVLERDPGLAMLLAIEAVKAHRSEPTLGALQASLAGNRELKVLLVPATAGTDPAARASLGLRPELLEVAADGNLLHASYADGMVRCWDTATGELRRVFAGHAQPLASLALSASGRRIATAAGDSARIWDAETGRTEWILPSPGAGIGAVAFSPEADRVILSSRDGAAVIWDVVTGRQLRRLEGPAPRRGDVDRVLAAFSGDGRRAMTVWEPGDLVIWDAASGEQVLALSGFRKVLLTPDWRYVCELGAAAIAAGGAARVHDTVETRIILELEGVFAAAFDGQQTLATSTARGQINVYSLPAAKPSTLVEPGEPRSELYFVGDSRHLLARRPLGHWRLWSVATGRKVLESESLNFTPEKDPLLWTSPDSRLFAAGGFATGIAVWSGGSRKDSLRTIVPRHHGVASLRILSSADRMATLSEDGSIRLWDILPAAELEEAAGGKVEGSPGRKLSADGKLAVAFRPGGAEVDVIDAGTGQVRHTLKLPGEASTGAGGSFSPDGQMVVTISATARSRERTARAWSTSTGAELWRVTLEEDHAFLEEHVSFSPDGRFLFHLVRRSSTLRAYDGRTGGEVWTIGGITAFQSSPDGLRLAAAGPGGKTLLLLDALGAKRLADIRVSSTASFSPDGRSLAAPVERERKHAILVLDAVTGFERFLLTGRLPTWSPDSRLLVAESGAGGIVACLAASGAETQRLDGLTGKVEVIQCHPDGRRALVAGASDLLLWDFTSGESRSLPGQRSAILGAEISRDGRHLLTVAREPVGRLSRAQVRDIETGEILLSLEHGQALRFSVDGSHVEDAVPGLKRRIPINLLDAAIPRRSRDLTPDERDAFEIGPPAERELHRRQYALDAASRELSALARQSRLAMLPSRAVDQVVSSASTLPALLKTGPKLQTDRLLAALDDLENGLAAGEPAVRLACSTLRDATGDGDVTLAAVDAALEQPLALVSAGHAWRFFRGLSDPSPDLEWTAIEFADGQWESGHASIGYGDGDDATLLADMRGAFSTVYLRARFQAPDPAQLRRLRLRVKADDGFIAYLNGVEIGRSRAGDVGLRLANDSLASDLAPEPMQVDLIAVDAAQLREGVNVLALQGLNREIDSSDFTLAATFEAEPVPGAPSSVLRAREWINRSRHHAAAAANLYLEARLLELADNPRQAAEKLEALLHLRPESPEALRRLAACVRVSASPAAAAARLQASLIRSDRWSRELWEEFLSIGFGELGQTAAQILASLPSIDAPPAHGFFADLRWALARLTDGAPLRILCGGDQDRGTGPEAWSRDRFYRGGRIRLDDDRRGPTRRHFPADSAGAAGYRLPLPRGNYRLSIHLAPERGLEPPGQHIAVSVEGKLLAGGWLAAPPGSGFVATRVAEVEVADGAMEIDVRVPAGEAALSAIEVAPLALGR